MTKSFTISTLNRGRFMLTLIVLLFLAGAISSLLPFQETYKIVAILFTIPIILFLAIRNSKANSVWTFNDDHLQIDFNNKTLQFEYLNIDHIRSLTRSGGSLYELHLKKGKTKRFWRNKLFQSEDDSLAMHHYLSDNEQIEYYKF